MSTSFTLAQLAEGVTRKNNADAVRLRTKWEKHGLLEGLSETNKSTMARILENQAGEILREANALSTGGAALASSGQVAGFTSVAFPIVRRVFGGLIANDLVSVQPMSLPAGLLFYMDYTYGSNNGGVAGINLDPAGWKHSTYTRGQSVYSAPVGAGIRSGSLATGGQYDLVGTGFSKVHKNALNISSSLADIGYWASGSVWTAGDAARAAEDFVGYNARFTNYDTAIENGLTDSAFDVCFMHLPVTEFSSKINGTDFTNLEQIAITGFGASANGSVAWGEQFQGGTGVLNLRKLNKRGNWDGSRFVSEPMNGSHIQFVLRLTNTAGTPAPATPIITASAAISDAFGVNSEGATLTIPSFETDFAVDASPRIPEVDFKIEATNVVATSRKLRARWSPEMAQDLTSYYAIDIEVEMTNILSEMITLDIDREILNDLLTQASAANYFWSRAPGRLVNKYTGQEALQTSSLSAGPMMLSPNQQDWYQTLVETITDAGNQILRKTLRGSANFLVTSPEVCTILEHLVSYKTAYKIDSDGQVQGAMSVGAEEAGKLNGRYTVYKDPYFPSNKILIGHKGGTFLESGYIYAPYVPLILTPVIYSQEDFVPRRGIMTRYGKKMVRSDFYATVTVLDMGII